MDSPFQETASTDSTNLYTNQIDKYNATTGALEYDAVDNNTYGLQGIAVSSGNVYALSSITESEEFTEEFSSGYLSVYSASNLTAATSPLITGLHDPHALAISGNNVYISEEMANGNSYIGEYNLTTGAKETFNINLAAYGYSAGLAVSGNSLYVSDGQNATITQYDATTGAQLSTFATDVNGGTVYQPEGIAIVGTDLFVAGASGGNIAEFTTSGGIVSSSLISNLSFPTAIAVVSQAGTLPAPTVNPISITSNPGTGGSYGNVTPVTATGGLGTKVSLIGGTDTNGAPVTLATTNLGSSFKNLASDVVNVTGSDNTLFALQFTFDLNAANLNGGASKMSILWLNPANNTWELANAGDHGTNDATSSELDLQGSFSAFEELYGTNLSLYLGAYGVDTSNDTTWAVIDHNSNFGAANANFLPQDVPEPSTWAMLLCGLGLLAFWHFPKGRALG
jgi:hypothetical protein